MINLNFGLWWSGAKLSYLRYLTFKSLRHFHPDSRIQLFVGDKFTNNKHKWYREKQDFELVLDNKKDYLGELKELNVEIAHVDFFSQYPSNAQSDFFRWWYLSRGEGCFYLDTDQIILRSFKSLPLDSNFIYSHYYNPQINGQYYPVGALGASKDCKLAEYIKSVLPRFYNPLDYNCVGPSAISNILQSSPHLLKDSFNAPSHYFYPISNSDEVYKIYNGSFKIPDGSYAIHWFGGHELSQAFNKQYTEEFAKSSEDTISRLLRDKKMI